MWPDDWYFKCALLAAIAYGIHWPIAFYIDRKLDLTHLSWTKRVSGMAPVGQALIVAVMFQLFDPGPFQNDWNSYAKLFWVFVNIIFVLPVVRYFCEASEEIVLNSNEGVHFMSSEVLPSSRVILWLPGIFLFRLIWLAGVLGLVDGKLKPDSQVTIRSKLPLFIPLSRALKLQKLLWVFFGISGLVGVLFWIKYFGFSEYASGFFLQIGLFALSLCIITFYSSVLLTGGIQITERGIAYRPSFFNFEVPWSEIREFSITDGVPRRLVIRMNKPPKFHLFISDIFDATRVTFLFPFEGDLEQLVLFLNSELDHRGVSSL